MDTRQQFDQAVAASKALARRPSNEIMLQLYGLYKQATEGNAPADGGYAMFDFVAKAKHDAWLRYKDLDTDTAMQQYTDLVTSLQQIH
jgi:diazepam-binding inhibitor (GABA receptor modulator, acyl-CoA-binding protein)